MAEFIDYYGTGRRKTAVARVHLRPGTGKIKINGKDYDKFVDYFKNAVWEKHAIDPITVVGLENKFDFVVRVHGGGLSGQAGAVRLGVARALLEYDNDLRTELKKMGMLTRDPRVVERKKVGLRKARKRAQFSKR
ncbi:30S ribosomal protein S9 [Oceanotoga sp. DSM 15011]|jgi:small subunit ribosomal protein S9|uniref:Small ribosomal subunit protein uS9 n=1 Tax=Oceanotoga teriensis TaxID=515440 RepID=A0AA45C649_9BACT|nr:MULTISPECIES: 30S ribosomal protein S9 [Oceanotoga]MDN5341745.1 small subunit ribosomal protein [Oceanotoga sp.]MDO7975657.1 30S ribosomal protein S9 [Oceanotoga teriensis]PWJ90594.1 SSU ribosomal protein S9P [Oceanotoga teriensis]UYO99839.1 30S ribosomal protein S9 [Oceanotoga sp. DSM 15011]